MMVSRPWPSGSAGATAAPESKRRSDRTAARIRAAHRR